jgi:hypothetical protein
MEEEAYLEYIFLFDCSQFRSLENFVFLTDLQNIFYYYIIQLIIIASSLEKTQTPDVIIHMQICGR